LPELAATPASPPPAYSQPGGPLRPPTYWQPKGGSSAYGYAPQPTFASGATPAWAPKPSKITKPRATGIDWLLALLMLLGLLGLLITQVLVWICSSDPTVSLGAFDGVIKAWPAALSDPTTTPLMMAAILGLEICAVLIPLRVIDWFWQHKGGRGAWVAWLAAAFGLSLGAFWAWGLTSAALTVWLWFIIGGLFAAVVWGNPRSAGAAITRFWSAHRLPGVRSGASGFRPAVLLAFYLAIVPAGMGLLGATTADLAANLPSEVTISGYASLAMPLTGATIDISALGSDGQSGASLASAVTDKNGYYSLSVWRSPGTALRLRSSGGSYVDEISGQSISAGPNDSLSAILSAAIPATDAASAPAGEEPTSLEPLTSLTPLSTFATQRAQVLIGAGDPVDDSILVSYGAVARQYDVASLTDVYPDIANLALDAQPEAPLYASRQLGLILAGLDQEANTLGVSEFALTEAIAQDISDGDLDGQIGSSPIMVNGTVQLPADATSAKLQAGINIVGASVSNLTYLPTPELSPWVSSPIVLLRGLGDIGVYVWNPSLPAFVDGHAGASAIQTGGGSGQVTCVLADGELPAHFWLSDCQIHYEGVPVLMSGHMWTSSPFSVKVSDTSMPSQSTTVIFQISVIVGPPEIETEDHECPPAGQPCSVRVATARGGVSPYVFFASSYFGGRYPLGMFMKTINSGGTMKTPALGDLGGDEGWMYDLSVAPSISATRAGSYSFQVCAVDYDGFAACDKAAIIVPPAPTPSPGPALAPTPVLAANWDGTYTFPMIAGESFADPKLSGGCSGQVYAPQVEGAISMLLTYKERLNSWKMPPFVVRNDIIVGGSLDSDEDLAIDSANQAHYSYQDAIFVWTFSYNGAGGAQVSMVATASGSNPSYTCTFTWIGTRN